MAQDSPFETAGGADTAQAAGSGTASSGTVDLLLPLAKRWRWLTLAPLAAGVTALGIAFLVPPTFTAKTVFLPPQQQQSMAASALASLGALSGLAGAAGGFRSPIDQYVALLQSTTVADRIIDRFDLMDVYDRELRHDTRRDLAKLVRVSSGRKEGLITVEVDDKIPKRAADIANAYVDELRRLTGQLALTEAQQRRLFFETQLKQTRDSLDRAQQLLQASGFSPGALKAEPKAAAEAYARLRAELTAAEVRLQTLRGSLTEGAAEVQQQGAAVAALRAQLARLESTTEPASDIGYIGKYRDFKYQEALFEVFSRQYEIARLDESREASLIQVVDPATPPERKSRPARALIAIVTTILTFLLLVASTLLRSKWQGALADDARARDIQRLRAALRGR